MDTSAFVRAEREAMADALLEVGPDAPTLCEGWTANDLAAHVVVRDRRPDSMPGVAVAPLAGWTERVRSEQARRPFDETVTLLREGPPRWSPFAWPGADAANVGEMFVHHEDVRRAQDAWSPRDLDPATRRGLWRSVSRAGRWFWRHSPVGVVLVVPDGPRRQVRGGKVSVVLAGQAEELLLHGLGRRDHALVDVSGPDDAVAVYGDTPLGA